MKVLICLSDPTFLGYALLTNGLKLTSSVKQKSVNRFYIVILLKTVETICALKCFMSTTSKILHALP